MHCHRSQGVRRLNLLHLFPVVLTHLLMSPWVSFANADELLIEDFERDSYGDWVVTGEAFGKEPAPGTLPNQHAVSGYLGRRLANTFLGGDTAVGVATSPEFKVQRDFIAFLIGGGANLELVGIELRIDDQVVRSATGADSETLSWQSWDVRSFKGKQAKIRIYDQATGGWGHINVDQIIQTDDAPENLGYEERLRRYRLQADAMNEPYRPQFHFSPEINWMNDPNGLVYHRGEYHLFHQFNPEGNEWGHMSWGHAVSRDLVHWEHLPIAIPEQDGVMAFSGCCVVDHHNTAGLGTDDEPAMIAIYTGHGHGKQSQYLAYSLDRGRTWKSYGGNPVLDVGEADFRDPKVFWHEPTQRWVMVVSFAAEKVLGFYGSSDLKSWKELSRFGPAGILGKSNWECPDLFELDVEGEPGKKLWVLEVDMGSGAVAGGSGGEYFVGTFDGTRFQTQQHAQWVDYGPDFYAPISWDNIPPQDGRRIWLGWFNNWKTCLVPTSPWRSCMSIPRSLSLKKIAFNGEEPATYVMVQRPVIELERLRAEEISVNTSALSWPPAVIASVDDLQSGSFEFTATLVPGQERSVGFRLRTGDDEYTEIGFDRHSSGVYVDRSKSGNVSFHEAFAGRHGAPARQIAGAVHVRVLVDRSTVEVFINDGEAVISERIFPGSNQWAIEAFAGGPTAKIGDMKLYRLRSIWHGDKAQ